MKEGERIPDFRVTPDKYLPHRYAGASGDFNPIHIDPEFAKQVGRIEVPQEAFLAVLDLGGENGKR